MNYKDIKRQEADDDTYKLNDFIFLTINKDRKIHINLVDICNDFLNNEADFDISEIFYDTVKESWSKWNAKTRR